MRDMRLGASGRWVFLPRSALAAATLLATAAASAGCGSDSSNGNNGGGDSSTVDSFAPDASDASPIPDSSLPTDSPADAAPEGAPQDSGQDTATQEAGASDGAPEAGVDDGTFATVTVVANGAAFSNPFDAAPDPTGASIYFTAVDPSGNSGVFSVAAAANSTATLLFSGAPLVSPFGIAVSSDGRTLFLADVGADNGTDRGGIFSMPAGAGAPTLVAGTDAYRPRSLEVVGSTLYFSGNDKTSGKPGVFSMPAGGGAITVVAQGTPFVDPSGVTADANGNVYVADTIAAGSQQGSVIKVVGGAASVLVSSLSVGYPAGLALSGDSSHLLSSSLDPAKGTDQLLRIDVTTGTGTPNAAAPIANNREAAGVHRAHASYAYAWVDSRAGGTGTVYLLTK